MSQQSSDQIFMGAALDEARAAAAAEEVPVGAVVVLDGEIIARGHNLTRQQADPSAHAEIVALRAAGLAQGAARLPGGVLYVTLEPCLMCLGAMIHARLARVVYGATDPKVGASRLLAEIPVGFYGLNHRVEISSGVMATEAAELLRGFFRDRRKPG